jgi:hypothetical protein
MGLNTVWEEMPVGLTLVSVFWAKPHLMESISLSMDYNAPPKNAKLSVSYPPILWGSGGRAGFGIENLTIKACGCDVNAHYSRA